MAARAINIVVVDDEPDVRTYLSMVLQQQGYFVRTADTATAGLTLLKEHTADLVCIDIMMPRESGVSLYKQMRADEKLAGIPVLFISGAVQAGDFNFQQYVDDPSLPPPEGYVEKPIVVEQFVATINRLVGAGKDHHAAT